MPYLKKRFCSYGGIKVNAKAGKIVLSNE